MYPFFLHPALAQTKERERGGGGIRGERQRNGGREEGEREGINTRITKLLNANSVTSEREQKRMLQPTTRTPPEKPHQKLAETFPQLFKLSAEHYIGYILSTSGNQVQTATVINPLHEITTVTDNLLNCSACSSDTHGSVHAGSSTRVSGMYKVSTGRTERGQAHSTVAAVAVC